VGHGGHGQLGQGNTNSLSYMTRVPGLPRIVGWAAGCNHTVCVSGDGRVFAWGYGAQGQLGQGNSQTMARPVEVLGMPPIRSVSCGFHFTICVGRDFSVWVFGHNDQGQLGLGTMMNALSPTKIDIKACQVACGSNHAVIVDPEGKLFCCGRGNEGQLGRSNTSSCSKFTFVKGIPRVKSVHCGQNFTLLVDEHQGLWSTGDNSHGCLGLGDHQNRHSFARVPNLSVSQVACGWWHVMCIDKESTLCAWGDNQHGQLTHPGSPKPVRLRQDAAAVCAGHYNTILRTTSDQVLVSGHNAYGQLAIGDLSKLTTWTPNPNIPPECIPTSMPSFWMAYRSSMSLTRLEEQQLEEVECVIKKARSHGRKKGRRHQIAPLSQGSWKRCADFLENKKQEYLRHTSIRKTQYKQQKEHIRHSEETVDALRIQLQEQENKLAQLKDEEQRMKVRLAQDEFVLNELDARTKECKALSQLEKQRCKELATLLEDTPLPSLQPDQLSLIWWRMDLSHFSKRAMNAQIDGEKMLKMDSKAWAARGLRGIESCRLQYMAPILALPGGVDILEYPDEEDCPVCMSNTVGTTINLLVERKIPIPPEVIQEGGWITPYLIYQPLTQDQFGLTNENYPAAISGMEKLRMAHEAHLATMI